MKHEAISPTSAASELDLPRLLELLAAGSTRPRYTFMVLNLIARAAGTSDSAGPYVREADTLVPVRDWLCDALAPMAARDHRRLALIGQVRADLLATGRLPKDLTQADQLIETEVRERVRASGKTNVSRAVSELVKAGFVKRHYQGYRVDHENRGAQRQAVYTIPSAVRAALAGNPTLAWADATGGNRANAPLERPPAERNRHGAKAGIQGILL